MSGTPEKIDFDAVARDVRTQLQSGVKRKAILAGLLKQDLSEDMARELLYKVHGAYVEDRQVEMRKHRNRQRGVRFMFVGGAIAAVAAGSSLYSYLKAASRPEGGPYVLFYGFIALGIVVFLYGNRVYRECHEIAGPSPLEEMESE